MPPDTDWAKIASEITPGAVNNALYNDLYPMWRELYPTTKDLVHQMVQLDSSKGG